MKLNRFSKSDLYAILVGALVGLVVLTGIFTLPALWPEHRAPAPTVTIPTVAPVPITPTLSDEEMFLLTVQTAPIKRPTLPKGAKWVPRLALQNLPITPTTSRAIIMAIGRMAAAGADVILFEINSPGGDVDTGFLVSRAIEMAPVPVVCVVDGKAASMAFFILQTCDRRLMTQRSYLMIHQPIAQGIEDSQPVPLENRLRRIQAVDKAMMAQYTRRMKLKPAELLARIDGGREYYLNSDDALKAGAVDGVVDSVEITQHRLARP